ncbi:MAG TPA: hypothetical protein VMU29_14310 [Smithella sp.]|nr:hypothetical protein [Smithella sp.]
MKTFFVSFMLVMMLFCFSFARAQDKLSADDVKFLKSCNLEQSDIDVIPKLPPGGQEKINLVLESSKKNCNMVLMKEYKATRDYLKKYTPVPDSIPMPPESYNSEFLTKEESDYINDISRKILDKSLENFNKNTK